MGDSPKIPWKPQDSSSLVESVWITTTVSGEEFCHHGSLRWSQRNLHGPETHRFGVFEGFADAMSKE